MKPHRLLALIAIALLAACTSDTESPVAVPDETVAEAAVPINPVFNVQFSATSAFFSSPNENEVPKSGATIDMWSPTGAFAFLWIPRIVKVEYMGTESGWLTGTTVIRSPFHAQLNLRATKGLPLGFHQAKITLTLLGVVNYTVWVNFASGLYFGDCAESTSGWTFGGLFHQTMGGTSVNPRGPHPGPDEGSYFFGYYSEATGDFNVPNGVANSGFALGPDFSIPASAMYPVLQVRTWYEIEYDVSPFSFDHMEFWLHEVGNPSNTVFIGLINVSGFMVGNGTTFGGGNPWVDHEFAIPPAALGKSWNLELNFATGDGAYNDYRGWGVDCMFILEGPPPPSGAVSAARAPSIDPTSMVRPEDRVFPKRDPGLIKR